MSLAHVAGHVHVRQEVHFDADDAVAGARLAAPALHVEREAVALVAARLCVGRGGEHVADEIEQAGIGGGVRARRASDGRLVDGDNLVQLLHAVDAVMRGGALLGAVQRARKRFIQNFINQRRFAAAGQAGDAGNHAQRDFHAYVAQVVGARAAHGEPAGRRAPEFRHGHAAAPAQIGAGERRGACHDLLGRSRRHDAPSLRARAGADVHDVIGCEHRFLVVLHDDQRVPEVAQAAQGVQKLLVVMLMQTNGRLVQNVQYAHQTGADLGGQPDALRLAAGQRARAARQREVVQPHVPQEAQPGVDLLQDEPGNQALLLGEMHVFEKAHRVAHGHFADLGDVFAVHGDRQRFPSKPAPAAFRAGRVGHVALVYLLHRVAAGFAVAALKVGNDALKRRLEPPHAPVALVFQRQLFVFRAVQQNVDDFL